jgi:WD40 repeat protein
MFTRPFSNFVIVVALGTWAGMVLAARADPTKDKQAAENPLRIWFDDSGKYTIQAKLVRIENDTVILLRKSGKEIAVALNKLSQADRDYLKRLQSASAPEPPPLDLSERGDPAALHLTPTDWNAVPAITLAPLDKWDYAPDAAPAGQALKATRVSLNPAVKDFDEAVRLILLPGEKEAFVVYRKAKIRSLAFLACDLDRGKARAIRGFSDDVEPLDVSTDGKTVLARTGYFLPASGVELRLYELKDFTGTATTAWPPFQPRPAATPKLGLALFLDANHILAFSDQGQLTLWEIPKLRPVYIAQALPGTIPALSPGRKFIAVMMPVGVAVLRAADGTLVGSLAADTDLFTTHALAFSPDGRQLALQQGGRLRVWDLIKRELTQDFATRGVQTLAATRTPFAPAWIDDDYIFLSGSATVDIERRVMVWRYRELGKAWQILGGRLWFVEHREKWSPRGGELLLTSAAMPGHAARAKLGNASADDLLVIRPGMSIAVEVQSNDKNADKQARQTLEQNLAQRGMKIVPQSEIRLVGTLKMAPATVVEYKSYDKKLSGSTAVSSYLLTLRYIVGNDTVWEHDFVNAAPPTVMVAEGETLNQVLSRVQDSIRIDSRSFERVWVPTSVARLTVDTYGDSVLPGKN